MAKRVSQRYDCTMWSLLWALRPSGLDAANVLTPAPTAGEGLVPRAGTVSARGFAVADAARHATERCTPPLPASARTADQVIGVADGGASRVSVSVCPGGAFITDMDLERASTQFNLGAALRFTSRVEAELACGALIGFLLEIPSQNGEAAILFTRTLKE